MTGQRMLTEPEAWREVARLVESGDPGIIGLATASGRLHRAGRTTRDMYERMDKRRIGFLRTDGFFGDDVIGECVLTALFLALEAEDDASTRLAAEIQEGR